MFNKNKSKLRKKNNGILILMMKFLQMLKIEIINLNCYKVTIIKIVMIIVILTIKTNHNKKCLEVGIKIVLGNLIILALLILLVKILKSILHLEINIDITYY